MVIGSSSTGGDTYLASSIVAEALSEKLGVSIKVDAVGAIEAFSLLKRNSDGQTIMVFHDQSYLGHIYQHNGYFDIFEDLIVGPTFASNPGNAYLVPKHSSFKKFEDVVKAVKNAQVVKVAIQPGGVSEIGFSAMKNAVKLAAPGQERWLIPIKTGSQSDLNQQLFDGQADIIYGSVQANEAYTHLSIDDPKAMRFIWLTAKDTTMLKTRPEGYGQTSREKLMNYVTPKVKVALDEQRDFVFDKEFFFLFNKQTDSKIIEYFNQSIREVFAEGKIQKRLSASFFSPNHRDLQDAQVYLKNKSQQIAKLLSSIKTEGETDYQVNENAWIPIHIGSKKAHLFFPKIIFTLSLIILAVLVFKQRKKLDQKFLDFTHFFSKESLSKKWRVCVCILDFVMYFVSMNWMGLQFPNKGYGFLFCSIPFMLIISYLFSQGLTRRQTLFLSLNSFLAPCLTWVVFNQLLKISLP
jgi:tripartite-type tricarboxylate transporter receptor subunit TctC